MLPRTHRLTRRQIQSLFKTGKRQNFPQFTLIYSPEASAHPQIAVIAPSSVAKLSSKRNKIRRLYYSQIQPFLSSLPPREMIILTKDSRQKPMREQISSQIQQLVNLDYDNR